MGYRMKEIESAIKLINTEANSEMLAKTIEILFFEIADRITLIPPLIKKIKEIETQKNIMCIGNAIQEISKVRSTLYEEWPHLKPDIAKEISENYEQYKKLAVEIDLAYKAEEMGDFAQAREIFSSIRASAGAASIKIQAEAGLFRLAEQEGHNN